MNALSEQILSELRHLLSEMSDGGLVGPSVYDTARALQFQGNVTGRQDAYAWLIAQQQADGGWGSADFPLFRHAPTWAHDGTAGSPRFPIRHRPVAAR